MLLCVWPAAPCHPGHAAPAQPATTTMRFGSPVGVVGFAAKVSCAVGIAVKAGESMLVPLLGGGLPAAAAGGAGFFSNFRRAKFRCYHSK